VGSLRVIESTNRPARRVNQMKMEHLKKYAVSLVVLVESTLLTTRGIDADQSQSLLPVTVTVIAPCATWIPNDIAGDATDLVIDTLMKIAGPIPERCDKRVVWRIDIDRGKRSTGFEKNTPRNAQIPSVYTNSNQTVTLDRIPNDTILITINF
jgi:hypothetical protein